MGGTSARLAYMAPMMIRLAETVVRKFTSANRARLNSGALAVIEWMMKRYRLITATISSTQVSVEPNQSFCWPRSSISCKAPTPMARLPKPKKSNLGARSAPLPGMNIQVPRKARMPSGRLM